jgi:CBS domain-containing protein/nitroimidazol reductase NimA-like FMN-containing flavoprotein (pyridoxamine 5'-phosphate oxidase superfamily)
MMERRMKAAEVMTRDVVTAPPSATITDAAGLLASRGISMVPVVDADGQLLGVVSEADLLRGRVAPDPRRHARPPAPSLEPLPHTIAEVMTRDVVAFQESSDVADIARALLEHRIKSVPIVSAGRLVGVVSRRDLLRTVATDDATIREEILARQRLCEGDTTPWTVEVEDGAVHVSGPFDERQRRIVDVLARTVPGVVRVTTVAASGGWREDTDREGLRVLDMDECFERLRSTPVGRLAFVSEGEPVILPVNHGVTGTTIVFQTREGSKLLAAERAASVAFEADGYETFRRYGWSVLARGVAEAVYDDDEIERYEALGIRPWADARRRSLWVRIRVEDVSGREIVR